MKQETHYLNTDLDLVSAHRLEALAAAFDSRGVFSLHVTLNDDGRWSACFETEEGFNEPESNIAAFLAAIEDFDERTREHWLACDSHELNIGYDCGEEPWAFNHGLSATTLARMAAFNISLRITLYPVERRTFQGSESTPAD